MTIRERVQACAPPNITPHVTIDLDVINKVYIVHVWSKMISDERNKLMVLSARRALEQAGIPATVKGEPDGNET